MGQAKNRGTYEERVTGAKQRALAEAARQQRERSERHQRMLEARHNAVAQAVDERQEGDKAETAKPAIVLHTRDSAPRPRARLGGLGRAGIAAVALASMLSANDKGRKP